MSIKLDISENIASYTQDLEKSLSKLDTELNSIAISLNVISKSQSNKIENLFTECENNLKHIEVELSLMPPKSKEKYSQTAKVFYDRLNKNKRTFNELRTSRNKLEKNERNSKADANTQLLKVSETLDEGSNMMTESIRTLVNVQSTDKDTQTTLKKQTDTLKNTTEKLNEADGYIQRSDLVIRNMLKRVFTNKLVLVALIILLGVINVFLLYIKIKYKILGFK